MKRSLKDALVVEVDGDLYLLKPDSARPLDGFADVAGDLWLLSDFLNAPPRFLTVESPIAYAEVMVQRRLQEAGEIEDQSRVFTHWKKARSKTSTTVLCTLVEGTGFTPYENRIRESPFHHLVFSTNALLFACLSQLGSAKRVTAVLFEHGQHVDLLVGRPGQPLGATRVSSFADTPEAKMARAATVANELRSIQESASITVDELIHFGWLFPPPDPRRATGSMPLPLFASPAPAARDEPEAEPETADGESSGLIGLHEPPSPTTWVERLAEDLQTRYRLLKPQEFDLGEGNTLVTALPTVAGYLSDSHAVNGQGDILAFRLQRLMAQVTVLILLLSIGMGLAGMWLRQQAAGLDMRAEGLTATATSAAVTVNPVDPAYKDVVGFSSDLARWRGAPSFQEILADLTQARMGRIYFDQVRIEFDDFAKASVTLTGAVDDSFEQASRDHELFLATLTGQGYRVVESRFAVNVRELTFTLKLERRPR